MKRLEFIYTGYCVYACYRKGGLAYIGMTGDPNTRKYAHLGKGVFDAFAILAEGFETAREALDVEARMIYEMKPPYNIRGNGEKDTWLIGVRERAGQAVGRKLKRRRINGTIITYYPQKKAAQKSCIITEEDRQKMDQLLESFLERLDRI